MPIERRFDADNRVLWTTMRDGLTIQDLRQHIDAVNELDGHQYCGIVDTRGAEPLFSTKEFPELARHGRRLFGHRGMAPRAVIVSETDLLSFGLARLFAALVAPWVTVRVFDNESAAVDYIEMAAAGREQSPTQ